MNRRPSLQFSAAILEAGVFRVEDRYEEVADLMQLSLSDPRYPGWSPRAYIVKDASMLEHSIMPDDLLTAVAPDIDEEIPLEDGQMVIVRYMVGNKPLSELTARVVELSDSYIRFNLADDDGKDVTPVIIETGRVPQDAADFELNTYPTGDGDLVSVEGIVTSVFRSVKKPA